MKLKKAIREHAIAIDALALITLHKRSMEDLGWYDEAVDTDLTMARKEYKRTQRQINAVMVAMQYRGVSDGGDPLAGLTTDSVYVSELRNWLCLQKYLWRLSRGYASRELKLALAKRACEFYLRNGDMKYKRYFIEDYYRMVFGVEVHLLEH